RSFLAEALRTSEPRVTWPSPAITTLPSLRTHRMVVDRILKLVVTEIPVCHMWGRLPACGGLSIRLLKDQRPAVNRPQPRHAYSSAIAETDQRHEPQIDQRLQLLGRHI